MKIPSIILPKTRRSPWGFLGLESYALSESGSESVSLESSSEGISIEIWFIGHLFGLSSLQTIQIYHKEM